MKNFAFCEMQVSHVPIQWQCKASNDVEALGAIAMAVLMTASFVQSVVRYACTCLLSSLPNNNGRPLFLSTSSFTAISLATCFLILRQFYLVLLPSSHTAVLERTARERFGKELYGRCYTVLCCPFPNTSLF